MTLQELWNLLLGQAGAWGCIPTGCAFVVLVLAVGCGFITSLLPAGWLLANGTLPLTTPPAPVTPDEGLAIMFALLPLFLFIAFILTVALIIDAEASKNHK